MMACHTIIVSIRRCHHSILLFVPGRRATFNTSKALPKEACERVTFPIKVISKYSINGWMSSGNSSWSDSSDSVTSSSCKNARSGIIRNESNNQRLRLSVLVVRKPALCDKQTGHEDINFPVHRRQRMRCATRWYARCMRIVSGLSWHHEKFWTEKCMCYTVFLVEAHIPVEMERMNCIELK